MFHQLKPLAFVGPPMTVPRVLVVWEPKRVPEVEGVERTLSVVVTCMRSFRENLVETTGGVWVVADTAADCPETFPAAS